MKILHVVTLCGPSGEFGGPQQVALNLTAELTERGHRVLLVAGARRQRPMPPMMGGVPVLTAPVRQVLPGAGFSGLVSPGLLGRIRAAVGGADLVHVHLSRDLVATPFALGALATGTPLVVQCNGMIDPSTRLLARPFDALVTRRVLARAKAVLCLTERERRDVEAVVGNRLDQATRLPNGVPPVDLEPARRDPRLVVFAARLHARKRPELFVQAAARVLRSAPDARFVIIGPDEGRLAAVRAGIRSLGVADAVSYLGPLPHAEVLRWLARAAVHVLPSADEPYGMTILEAMSVGTPVVVMDCCALAQDVRDSGAGLVSESDPDSIGAAIGRLLDDPDLLVSAGEHGRRAALERFGITAVVDRLESIYQEATEPVG
ncbi:MAG TPA: glycosyltransferase [Mycobacteriales bacterium]